MRRASTLFLAVSLAATPVSARSHDDEARGGARQAPAAPGK